mgnify:CR=1 FL=1
MEPLGASGLRVDRIVIGAMDRRERPDAERERLLEQALDLGFTTFDTAPLYGFGRAERLLGEVLARRSERVVVATKVGLRWGENARGAELFRAPGPEGRPVVVRRDSRPASVRSDVEASLQRLGLERLDLVQVHQPDLEVPIEETMGTLLDLRSEGKLLGIGVSNFDLEQTQRAARALGDVPLACLQLPYNLLARPRPAILDWARRRGVGVLGYSPLGEGLLAGRYLEQLPPRGAGGGPYQHPANIRRAHRALETVYPVARAHDAPLAAVSLAALLGADGLTAPVVGVSRPAHLQAAAQAREIRLSPSERGRITEALLGAGFEPRAGSRRRDRWLARIRRILPLP